MISRFNDHNPFLTEPCLKSFSTGIISTKGINCDDAKTVGKNIQKSLDNLTVEETKIKTLDTLQIG